MKTTLLIIFCFFLYINIAEAKADESEGSLDNTLYESDKRRQHAQSKPYRTTNCRVEMPQVFYKYATWSIIFSFILILLLLYSSNKIKNNRIDQLKAQNTEMKEQKEELLCLIEQLSKTNKKLENKAKVKTILLERQNEKIMQYAFITAHKLRAPLASILGLVNVIEMEMAEKEKVDDLLLTYLKSASENLDKIVHEVQNALDESNN